MADTTASRQASAQSRSRASRFRWGKVFTYTVLIVGVALMVFPFLWMLSASLMSLSEITFGKLLPSQLQLRQLRRSVAARQLQPVHVEQRAHHRHHADRAASVLHPGGVCLRADALFRAQRHVHA